MNWDSLFSLMQPHESPWGADQGQSTIMPVGPAVPFHPGFTGQPVPGPTQSLPPTGFVGQPVPGPASSPYGHYLD